MMHAMFDAKRLTWAMLLSIGVLGLWIIMMDPAFAQVTVPASGGGAEGNIGPFRCQGYQAVGSMYESSSACPTTMGFSNIFSFLVCNMERLSSDLMGSMFCGMIQRLKPMVFNMLTLAVAVFAAGFTIGVIPATAREFQKFLLKVGLIVGFATQADMIIGIAYTALVGGAREGVLITLGGLPVANQGSGGGTATVTSGEIYARLDGFLAKVLQFATDYVGAKWDGSAGDTPCRNAIFAALALMGVIFPPIFYFAVLILARIAITFMRAVFGYIYAIIGIAFLLTLSPLFVSAYMFQPTRPFFDKWLGYLVSFALQMVIVFAFLTFIISIDVKTAGNNLIDLVVPYQETTETTTMRFPWQYCTLCKFQMLDENNVVVPKENYSKYIGKGKLECIKPDGYDPNSPDPTKKVPYIPIKALSAISPDQTQAIAIRDTLMSFAATSMLSLLVLAYVVDSILALVPMLAQSLAGGLGGNYAPQLGGGYSPKSPVIDMPGMSGDPYNKDGVLDSFGRGFQRGYNQNYKPGTGETVSNNTFTRAYNGLETGFKNVFASDDDKTVARSNIDPSLKSRFFKLLVNPLDETPVD